MSEAPKIAIIAGEESGQLLGADLIEVFQEKTKQRTLLFGVGGAKLETLGLKSLFDPNEIALTGISSVVASLPKLIRRIGQTAEAIVAAKPDCLLLIDSPDFSLRVAKKVKQKLPHLPIIKYVAPSVWAWRPGRAAKMAQYVDDVLAILPFEPAEMERLGGPRTHYVGHRLMADEGLSDAWSHNSGKKLTNAPINLLVLPGSRTGEIKRLCEPFSNAVEILRERGNDIRVTIPTLERHEDEIHRQTAAWRHAPSIITGREAQLDAYKNADVALAASGTVTLELALAGVPAISCYKIDPMMRVATHLISAWSAALPNLIADKPVISEYYNEQIRPGMLARSIEVLGRDTFTRKATLEGYELVRERMHTDTPASEAAASILIKILKRT